MRMPSWKMSYAEGAMVPGPGPPAAQEWVKVQEKHRHSPFRRTGFSECIAGRFGGEDGGVVVVDDRGDVEVVDAGEGVGFMDRGIERGAVEVDLAARGRPGVALGALQLALADRRHRWLGGDADRGDAHVDDLHRRVLVGLAVDRLVPPVEGLRDLARGVGLR